MSNRIAATVLMICGLITVSLFLRNGEVANAGGEGLGPSRAVYFDISIPGESTEIIGTVPPGKRLTLKDFWTEESTTGEYEVLADGNVVGYGFRVSGKNDENTVTSFEIGFTIRGGQQLSIRRIDRNGEPSSFRAAGMLDG